MKTLIATLLVLFLSIPTVMADIDNKGLWCPAEDKKYEEVEDSLGLWFEGGNAYELSIVAYDILTRKLFYEERTTSIRVHAYQINYIIDRSTLILTSLSLANSRQCTLVSSRSIIVGELTAIINNAKAENKL